MVRWLASALLVTLFGVSAAAAKTTPDKREDTLTVVSYNVCAKWIDKRRIPHLLSTIGRTRADLILLQEVVPWFVRRLRAETWFVAGKYRLVYRPFKRADRPRGGLAIVTRLAVTANRFVPFGPGPYDRGVQIVGVVLPGKRTLTVANTHLVSYLKSQRLRRTQLALIFRQLQGATNVLLGGDFNFGDGEPESSSILTSYRDLWQAIRPGKPGLTWNIERSPLARRRSFPGEKSRRLDRLLLRGGLLLAHQIRLIGDTPLPEDRSLFPSDHFGLLAQIRVSRPLPAARPIPPTQQRNPSPPDDEAVAATPPSKPPAQRTNGSAR